MLWEWLTNVYVFDDNFQNIRSLRVVTLAISLRSFWKWLHQFGAVCEVVGLFYQSCDQNWEQSVACPGWTHYAFKQFGSCRDVLYIWRHTILHLPGHVTHRLQHLDVAIFKLLDTFDKQTVNKWLRKYGGHLSGVRDMFSAYRSARQGKGLLLTKVYFLKITLYQCHPRLKRMLQ
jgi:hypothetical protein